MRGSDQVQSTIDAFTVSTIAFRWQGIAAPFFFLACGPGGLSHLRQWGLGRVRWQWLALELLRAQAADVLPGLLYWHELYGNCKGNMVGWI